MKRMRCVVIAEVDVDVTDYPDMTPANIATYVAGALSDGFAADGNATDKVGTVTAYEIKETP